MGIFMFVVGSSVTISSIYIIFAKYRHNPRILRKPRYPFLSYLLSFHVIHSFVLDAVFLCLAFFTATRWFPSLKIYQIILIGIVLIPVVRFVVVNGIIRHLKWCLGSEFNVVIFRRFSSEYAHANRALIAPILGAYGKVTAIYDESLAGSDAAGPNADSESILGESHMAIHCGDHDWRNTVRHELAKADLAIFDWPDMPTENMQWEFKQAICALPEERLFWICVEPTADKIEDWLGSAGLDSDKTTVFRIEDRIDYVGGNYKSLSKAVYNKLKTLEVRNRMSGVCL
jgi:hypothetical protein